MDDKRSRTSRQQLRAMARAERKASGRKQLANAAVAVGAALAATQSANAAIFTVTNTNDGAVAAAGDQPGTLRQAIFDANANPGPDIIQFSGAATSGTITLAAGQFEVLESVDIQGPGASSLTIDANNLDRIFYLYDNTALADITISGLTLLNGSPVSLTCGGAIVTYENLTLDGVTIAGNDAVGKGGGICKAHPTSLTITNSTFNDNVAGTFGGALYLYGGTISITNTTLSGNSANTNGGAISADANATIAINVSTIAGNDSSLGQGDNIWLSSSSLVIQSSIVADPATNDDIQTVDGATVTSYYSLIEVPGSTIIGGANNTIGTDPQLALLSNNGGTTATRMPQNPAVFDAGAQAFVGPALDQRAGPRIVNGRVDMGSVEVDPGIIEFQTTSDSVSESAGSIQVFLNRTGGTAGTVSVDIAIDGSSTATLGDDFTGGTPTVTWIPGDSFPASFTIPILDDNDNEGPETIVLNLTNPTGGATIGDISTIEITIDDHEPSTIPVNTNADEIVDDGDCSLREAIANANNNNGDNDDCVAGTGFDTITFVAPGDTGTILMDSSLGQFEVTEGLTIQGPGKAALSIDAQHNHRIFYLYGFLEPTPTVSISGLTLKNGNATGFLEGGAGIYSTANLVLDGVDIQDSDAYWGGAIYIPGGYGRYSELTIQNKSIISGNSALFTGGGILVGAATDVTITDSEITGNTSTFGGAGAYLYFPDATTIERSRITDNIGGGNGGGLLMVSPIGETVISETTFSGNEGGDGGGIQLVTSDYYYYCPCPEPITKQGVVINSPPPVEEPTVNIIRSTISGNIAIGEGATGGGINIAGYALVNIENSTIAENDAEYSGGGIATFYYYNSGSPVVTISLSTIAGNLSDQEGGNVYHYYGSMTVTNSIIANGASLTPANADLFVAPDASFTANFTLIENPGSAVIGGGTGNVTGTDPDLGALGPNGGLTDTMMPNPGSDAIDAGDPAFTGPPNIDQTGDTRIKGGVVDMGSVETPFAGVLQFAVTSDSVNENGVSILITVTRTGGSDGAVSVPINVGVTSTAAGGGVDFTLPATTLNWADADSANKTFSIQIDDDMLVEGNETIVLEFGAPSGGATIGANSTETVTIVDVEEGVLQFLVTTDTVSETGGSITITVTRTNGDDGAVSVPVNVNLGSSTATGGGADYTFAGTTLNWADGDAANKTFNIPIHDDAFVEGNETIALEFGAPTGGAIIGANSTETVTITDVEEGVLQFAVTTDSVSENGGSITVTVTRTNGDDGAVSVPVSVNVGSSTATGGGTDFTFAGTTLNWADGDSANKTFNIQIDDDSLVEGNETIALQFGAPTGGATIGANSTEVITVVDHEPGVLQFAVTTDSVLEDAGSILVTVTRTNGDDGAVSVPVSVNVSSTATGGGTDYTFAGTTLNWADNDSASKSFSIPITNDLDLEGNETIVLDLGTPTGGAVLGANTTETITILDDEIPQPGVLQFLVATDSVAEDGGSITITVTRTSGDDGAVSVPVNVNVGSSTATGGGVDFTFAGTTLNWADQDSANKTFNVTINDDVIFEGNETFLLQFGATAGGATIGANATETVTITENDPPSADLSVDKAVVGGGPFVVGQNAQFLITVTNAGPAAATNVIVTDDLPAGTTFVSATPSQGGPCTGATTITCNLGTINDGASATITLTVTLDQTGQITNEASATSAVGDPTPVNTDSAAIAVTEGVPIPLLDERMLIVLITALAALGIITIKRT